MGLRACCFGFAALAATLSVIGLALSAAYIDARYTSIMYGCLDYSVNDVNSMPAGQDRSKCHEWYKDFLKVSSHPNAQQSKGMSIMLNFAGPIAFSVSTLSCILFVVGGISRQERQLMSSLAISIALMFLSCGFGFKALSTNNVTVHSGSASAAYYTINHFMKAYIGLSIVTLFVLSILVIILVASKPEPVARSAYSGPLSISAEEPSVMTHEMS